MHGPFLGISTSRSVVKFNFSDPASAMNAYSTSRGNTQLRLEGGYQVSSKPIYFKKADSYNKSSTVHYQKNIARKSCGSSITKSGCGSKIKQSTAGKSRNKGSWVRIQPSLGVAYIPFTPSSEIYTKSQGAQTVYEYNAGNWKTAVISGMGFEFGNNAQRAFVISVNYLKSMGNRSSEKNMVSGNKPINTRLESGTSGWNLRMGIPIGLSKARPSVKHRVIEKTYKEEKKCGQYRIHYKPRCSKTI